MHNYSIIWLMDLKLISSLIKQLIMQQCINAIYDKIIFNFSDIKISPMDLLIALYTRSNLDLQPLINHNNPNLQSSIDNAFNTIPFLNQMMNDFKKYDF